MPPGIWRCATTGFWRRAILGSAWCRRRAQAGTRSSGNAAGRTGSFLFLDNGSTSLVVAEELPRDSDLIAATSSIEIAATLAARGDVQIHMVGGEVDTVIGGSIDGMAIEAVTRLNIDTCFLGVCALSADGGVSAFDAADATFKRVLVARSRCTLILATNEKIGAQGPHRIAALNNATRVIVEYDADEAALDRLRAAGAKIDRARPSPEF